MALVIGMAHAPGQHVGHGFEAAMRMLGKTGDVVRRIVRAELVQQQERIDPVQFGVADQAVEPHPGAVADRNAAHEARQAHDAPPAPSPPAEPLTTVPASDGGAGDAG